MSALGTLAKDALQTALRMAPWPTEPGLRAVGSPGPQSPVLVTCNYDLTVRRLAQALRGHDAWLVVAPTAGINVWCAAAGGHLTTHQVVTALKTSGVAERVEHRRAVLPQLAATGVSGLEVFRRCHWQTRFGPVRAEDLPRYLDSGMEKDEAMRRVRFGPRERLEMAAAWGVPAAVLLGGATLLLRPAWAAGMAALCLALAVGLFLGLDRLPGPRRSLAAGLAAVIAVGATFAAGGGAVALAAAGAAAVALTGLLTFDWEGSTPVAGGSHFEERRWHIRLDLERCGGVLRCVEVCPEACFAPDPAARKVALAHDDRCIRCGACVVQCPKDALAFEDEAGERIDPEVIRRYKLNLLGRRRVDAGSAHGAPPPGLAP